MNLALNTFTNLHNEKDQAKAAAQTVQEDLRLDMTWYDGTLHNLAYLSIQSSSININHYIQIYSIIGRPCWYVGAHGKGLTMDDFKQLPESERQELEDAWQADSDGFDGCFQPLHHNRPRPNRPDMEKLRSRKVETRRGTPERRGAKIEKVDIKRLQRKLKSIWIWT